MPDSNKYDNTKPDILKNMFDMAVNTVSAPSAMVHNPGVAGAGLLIGAARNIGDPIMAGASAMQHIGNYITGQGPVKADQDWYKKYDSSLKDLALNVGSGFNPGAIKDKKDAERAAAAGEFLGSFVGMHAVGKMAHPIVKGGAAGIVGETISEVNKAKATGVSNLAKVLPDSVFQGAGAIKKGISTVSNKVGLGRGDLGQEVFSLLNPKTATDIVAGKAPELMVELSKRYNTPVAKIKDLQDPLYRKFTELQDVSEKPINIRQFVDDELKSLEGSKTSHPVANEVLRHELEVTLKSAQAEFGDIDKAHARFDELIDAHKEQKKLYADFYDPNKPITDPESAAQYRELYNQMGSNPEELVTTAKRIRNSYEKEYINQLLDPSIDNNTAMESFSNKINTLTDKLESVNPQLASDFHNQLNKSFVARLGQLGNSFKVEPIFGDFTQINEALPISLIKNAEKIGVDSTQVYKYKTGFSKWFNSEGVSKTFKDTLISPNRSQFDAVYNDIKIQKGGSVNPMQRGPSLERLMDYAADVGMSNQIQFRERMIESVILPEAYGQVKAFGLKEGTKEFNTAVFNNAKSLIEDSGMIPPEVSKKVITDSKGFVTTKNQSLDSLMVSLDRLGGEAGKHYKSTANFMLKWIKGATQAKLKSWNVFNDTLDTIGRTGKVTDAQKALVTNSFVDLVAGVYLFGARGVRIPGLITEEIQNVIGGNDSPDNMATNITGAVASLLKIDPELTRTLKDGLFYKLTGLSSARTNNMPLPGFGAGNEIFRSIAIKKFGPLIKNLIGNVATGNGANYFSSGQFGTDIVGILTSQDTQISTDVAVDGKRYDSKGNPIEIDEEKHPLAHWAWVDSTKNQVSSLGEIEGVDLRDAGKNTVQRYDRLSLQEISNKETFKQLVVDLSTAYNGDPTKVKTTIKKIIRNKLLPHGGEIFNNLDELAAEYNLSGKEGVIDNPYLNRLTKQQVIEQAALSAITQRKSKKVLKMLIATGKIDLTNEEDVDMFKTEIRNLMTKLGGQH